MKLNLQMENINEYSNLSTMIIYGMYIYILKTKEAWTNKPNEAKTNHFKKRKKKQQNW